MNILLFGAPGAGKGTQSALLVERLKMHHISTGDLFRRAIKGQTELGMLAKSYMDKGQLVPDSVTIDMVREELKRIGDKDFILDGFPRNVAQAEALDVLLKEVNRDIGKALFLHVPMSDLVERLSGRRLCRACGAVYHVTAKPPTGGKCDNCGSADIYQRDDDKPEAITTRLQVYENSTAPLKEYYSNKKKLVELDGRGKEEGVFDRVKAALS